MNATMMIQEAESLVRDAEQDGLKITLNSAGKIHIEGNRAQREKWVDVIRTHRCEIVGALRAANDPPVTCQNAGGTSQEPFDRESFEERAAICEFDGGLSREEAEATAWHEDNRRRCAHCLNLATNGICRVAEPGGQVHARRGYQPNQNWLHRCLGYRPCPDDPDRRPGRERWPNLT